jgi:hypothetical protein|tara:strand:- start:5884 stop:6180 length:297 start_codon:yes stop_codon:yes gene_type:complete
MFRCDYCGRILYKNVSGKYNICSAKCKSKFKNKKLIRELELVVFSEIKNGIKVSDIVSKLQYEKFDIVSAVRRLTYQEKKIYLKTSTELNLKSLLFIK